MLTPKKKTYTEIIKEEYRKCAMTPGYFLKKYAKIQHPKRGKIDFLLYPFQEACLDEFLKYGYNIILKSRQLGLSTLTAGYILWMMIFGDDKSILVIATKQEVAKNLVKKIQIMYLNLPSWLKVGYSEFNKLSLVLNNGSNVKAVASSEDAGRSDALSLLVLDEAAFIDKIDAIWTSAQQTLATGGDCIVLSTPNGVGNWFHKEWQKAIEGTGAFNPIKLHWTVHPERDQSWRNQQTKNLGERAAAQECDCDFLSSGHNVVDAYILKEYEEKLVKEPLEKRGFDKNLWLWEYPMPNKSYIVVADVSRGDASDYSAAHVFDIETMEQVAEYKGMLDTNMYGDLLIVMATEYNNALLVVERENVGWAVIQRIIDREYRNLFYSSTDLTYVDSLAQYTNKINRQERNMKPGFSTTTKTRPLVISKLEEYFRDQSLVIYSQRLINELQVFIWKNGKAQAMEGHNDDLVMALGIALWVRDTALKLRQEGVELTKMTLDKFTRAGGNAPKAVYTNSDRTGDPYKVQVGKTNEDIRWLF